MNARDNYGNSLFILVCQQGNKRIAKFLMRRRADMNLQVRVYLTSVCWRMKKCSQC